MNNVQLYILSILNILSDKFILSNQRDKKKKIRVIDYNKINGNEKKLKNKMGIDKIKIVYFD